MNKEELKKILNGKTLDELLDLLILGLEYDKMEKNKDEKQEKNCRICESS